MSQVGGSFGAAAGLVLMENLPVEWNIQPGIYAIVGATAMLGGVFRSSISLVGAVRDGAMLSNFVLTLNLTATVAAHGSLLPPNGPFATATKHLNLHMWPVFCVDGRWTPIIRLLPDAYLDAGLICNVATHPVPMPARFVSKLEPHPVIDLADSPLPCGLQVVIVVEGTRGIDFLFGVIIAVVASNWIAQHVHSEGAMPEIFIPTAQLAVLPEPSRSSCVTSGHHADSNMIEQGL
jgi:hypothetical protein